MTGETVARLVTYFASERGNAHTDAASGSERERLTALLTTRAPAAIPADVARQLDGLLAAEATRRPTTTAAQLSRIRDHVPGVTGPIADASIWQGDITTLVIDAIVNAANNRLLGCFIPGHRCIDNAIHAAAGPELRAECARIMHAQGHPEPPGQAKVTAAYHLPAKHVIHTVGPIVTDHQPTADDAALLASSYRACLDAALAQGVASIAFCSISTGVFGYPIDLAAPVAVDTVASWLLDHPTTTMHVVFNTFAQQDTDVYLATLATPHR